MHWDPLWLAGTIVVGVFLLNVLLALLKGSTRFPYTPCESLLTPAERNFFAVLQKAVGDDFHLFAKVRLADILNLRDGVTGKDWRNAFNRISSKHADFVACDPETFCVLGVIELDDSSHERRESRRNDEFKNDAFAAASIPILRVKAQRSYSQRELAEQIRSKFL